MRTIAHRGAMTRGLQNSPAGVRLAAERRADFVELDVLAKPSNTATAGNGNANTHITFVCAHGLAKCSLLADCLREIPPQMSLILHLKGCFDNASLSSLLAEV